MRICKENGCSQKHCAKGWCIRHWNQFDKHGRILGNPERSYRDSTDFIIEGEICRIKLCDVWGNEKAEAIIDAEDYHKVKDKQWYLDNHGYPSTGQCSGMTLLHTVIIGEVPEGMEIDHRNLKGLDNRKANLRVCSHSESRCNKGKPKNNTSGYKGISFHKLCKKWTAHIAVNKKQHYLGLFTDKIEAALAYNKAALVYHGDYARLNEGV